MNRKQRRKFDQFPVEQKAQMIQTAVLDKAKPVMANAISNAMINGINMAREELYQKYVTRIDSPETTQEEREKEIDNLLSFLRVSHLKRVQSATMDTEEGGT